MRRQPSARAINTNVKREKHAAGNETASAALVVGSRNAAFLISLISAAAGQTFTSIDFPGSPATNVNGIDSSGAEMVGDHFDVASGNEYGYLLSGELQHRAGTHCR